MLRKVTGILAVVLLLAGMALLAGCGGSSGQSGGAGTQATESMQQGGVQGGAVSEPDLTDVPIYPGAEKVTMTGGGPGGPGGPGGAGGAGGSMPTPPSGGNMPGPASMVRFTTSDSADVVIAWYRGQLSGREGFTEATGTVSPQGGSQNIFTFKTGDTTMSVMVGAAFQGQSGTAIIIAEGTGGIPAGPPPGQTR